MGGNVVAAGVIYPARGCSHQGSDKPPGPDIVVLSLI